MTPCPDIQIITKSEYSCILLPFADWVARFVEFHRLHRLHGCSYIEIDIVVVNFVFAERCLDCTSFIICAGHDACQPKNHESTTMQHVAYVGVRRRVETSQLVGMWLEPNWLFGDLDRFIKPMWRRLQGGKYASPMDLMGSNGFSTNTILLFKKFLWRKKNPGFQKVTTVNGWNPAPLEMIKPYK